MPADTQCKAARIKPWVAAVAVCWLGMPVLAEPARAVFAGGCFWCVEDVFEAVDGVIEARSGYTGGSVADPSYDQVSAGSTGHVEAVEVTFDPTKTDYPALLAVFWRNIDPLEAGGQFCDRGRQYRAAIFYGDDEQRKLAERSKASLDASGILPRPIVTEILAATPFYPAEKYHQDYHRNNPARYQFYKWKCGRAQRLDQIWGKTPKLPFAN